MTFLPFHSTKLNMLYNMLKYRLRKMQLNISISANESMDICLRRYDVVYMQSGELLRKNTLLG